MLSSENNIRYLIGTSRPAMIAQREPGNRAQAGRGLDDARADRCHGGADHGVAEEALGVLVLVRPDDGAVLVRSRDPYLRRRSSYHHVAPAVLPTDATKTSEVIE